MSTKRGSRSKGSLRKEKKNGPDATLTPEQWQEIVDRFESRCAYCGIELQKGSRSKRHKLTQDHVIPLSRGGTHSADNVVPACPQCNTEKGDQTLDEWLESKNKQAQNR